ncbi:MAG: hypothetical protein EZS28_001536 [Streblomastix strix]|uniref:Uncharacterized protein n=1 Tax=Streblomastix strix TaxID=222440 RepID=A0A5J4X7D5_9EUKA|nr:MAG: hypothetical protein EZS28_001536 [Streblomastix strix]
MNDWMAVPDNVATLVIGDNLYIIDSSVMDYWWDGTQLRELETQLPDLTNVVTTLGEATGSGNAITDLNITGNILTPAKNKNFVDLEYNQTIKLFIDEKLLETAGLTDFPELYAYFKELEPKSSEEQPQSVPIVEQTLQDQVKQNAAIINDEENEFVLLPIENIQPKVDLQDGLEKTEGCTWLMEVKFNGQPGNRDVEFAGTYINDTYVNPDSTDFEAANKASSRIDEVIAQQDSKVKIAPLFTDYAITDFINQVQFADDFRNGQIEIINEGYVPPTIIKDCTLSSSYAMIDSGDKGLYIHLSDPVQDVQRGKVYYISGTSKVGKGLQQVNDKVVKPVVLPAMKQFSGIIPVGGLIRKGIETGSSALDAFYGQAKAIQVQGLITIESYLESNAVSPFKNDGEHHYSFKEIKPESQMSALFDKEIIVTCRIQITMREIEEATGTQTNIPYLMPVRFRIPVLFDDILIFSAFTDYPNGMFADLKIKFKINSNAFVFAQVNPTKSLVKYYTMNKDELLTDLITSIKPEELTQSGQKNLICDINPVIISIKNYVITEVTANIAGYKANDTCLARVRDFFTTRAFVVPAQSVEIWPFPTSATHTRIRTSQNIPLSHVTDINASTLDQLFEANDEFEDALTTPRNTATRRPNPHIDLTSFMISLQCERNSNGTLILDGLDAMNQKSSVELRGAQIYQGITDSYYNVDTNGK